MLVNVGSPRNENIEIDNGAANNDAAVGVGEPGVGAPVGPRAAEVMTAFLNILATTRRSLLSAVLDDIFM